MVLLAGLLTKVAFIGLLRLWHTLSPPEAAQSLLLWLGGITLLSGTAAALRERDLRRFASWMLAGEMGYLLLAIALGGAAGTATGLYLVLHMALGITFLILACGLCEELSPSPEPPNALLRRSPPLAAAFGLAALILSGLPPFSGFVAKVALLQTAAARQAPWVATVILLGGFISLAALARMWVRTCQGPKLPLTAAGRGPRWPRYGGAASLFALLCLLFVFAGPLYESCRDASLETDRTETSTTSSTP